MNRVFEDYDFELKYHAGKANVVTDALSRKCLYIYISNEDRGA